MIIDSQNLFSSAQAVTATGDTASTNVLDTSQVLDEGVGEECYLIVKSVAAVTSGGAATVQAVLQTSSDNSTWTDVDLGPAIGYATITTNYEIYKRRLPTGLKRYIRVAYRVGTAVLTAGTFTAFLTKDTQSQQFGATGFTVDV